MKDKIEIYTDGSSLGNPGPGGYGVVLLFRNKRLELSRGFEKTTNNRMELLAVIEGLKALNTKADDMEIVIYTDSKYVKDGIEKGWVFNWQRKGFQNKANPDLWRVFLDLYKKYRIRFEWVKGHSGVPENERCDLLARAAAKSEHLEKDLGYDNNLSLL